MIWLLVHDELEKDCAEHLQSALVGWVLSVLACMLSVMMA